MAQFRFAVFKERLELLTPTKGRSDNLNTDSAKFDFRSPEWEGVSKWAHFINYDYNNGEPYVFNLINDEIPAEEGLNLPTGVWDVYLHGDVLDEQEFVRRLVTNPVSIVIVEPNDIDGDELPPIGPSEAEQIDAKATAAWNTRITSATATINDDVGTPYVTVSITGENGDKSLNLAFGNLKGEQGEQGIQGEQGEKGDQGDPGEKGDQGDPFTYDDFTPEQLEALTGPQGEQGPQGEKGEKGDTGQTGQTGATGATPDISIGTVTEGDTAAATMTGTAEYPVLNLVLPKGDKGDTGQTGQTGATGATPELSIGTVSTGAAGSSATVTITGTAEEPVLNFSIPKGDTGATGQTGQTGATPDISIGTVTSGSTASATMTGTAAEPVLNLVLPKGDTGQTGATGADGTDGTTFTPAVSSAGVISWTNDGGKQNPQSVDMVTAVINALPSAVGVEF